MIIDARSAARVLGGEVIGRNQIRVPGPGHSPKDRSLIIWIDPTSADGFTVHSHSGDDFRDARDHVRSGLGLPKWQPGDERDRRVSSSKVKQFDADVINREVDDGPREWTEDQMRNIEYARRIWDEAEDPRLTLAEQYLNEQRNLDLPSELAGTVLRFHPRCPWRDENTGQTIRVPALIVPFRSIDDNSITAIHRIRLNPDGSKVDRWMLGPVHRVAVKLGAVGEQLAISEGVETGMAGRQLSYSQAVWALGSAGGITKFPVIDGVKELLIFSEACEKSKRAIQICGRRWRKAGRRVRIAIPPEGCKDLNDVLIKEARR